MSDKTLKYFDSTAEYMGKQKGGSVNVSIMLELFLKIIQVYLWSKIGRGGIGQFKY